MNPTCRFCETPLRHTFVDLGTSPLANAYLRAEDLQRPEPFYPLHVYVCHACFLVQLPAVVEPRQLFEDYAYFSSYSDSWLEHARRYADTMVQQLGLGRESQVIEIASNDGYLLQYFVRKGIPVLGIEPAKNVARAAQDAGVPTLVAFFGSETARKLAADNLFADLLVGNNVLAHVPDLNDFVAGMRLILKPEGVITMEFPHLLQLMQQNQFDTIYHEHVSYFSLLTVQSVFDRHGLTVFDVEELPTHGGSLRIYARHSERVQPAVTRRVEALLQRELDAGLNDVARYHTFAERVRATKASLLTFLLEAKAAGKSVIGYGAPAKGNTLLNYCGIRTDFLDYTVDRSPHKQNRFLPGTRIPIRHPDEIRRTRPDYLLLLPWNLKDEIMQQMACVREWGGRFVVPIPEVRVYD